MAVLDLAIVGFIVIFLASLLFFGEFLVKAKGIFGLIGVLLFLLYFIHNLPGQSPILMIVMLVVGFVFIVIDGKLINNGSVAVIGLFLMMLACALPTPSFTYGLGVAAAFILGVCCSFLFLKVFSPRSYWSKMTLVDQLTSERGYNSINNEYKTLVGKTGKAITPFRPVGTIDIEGVSYSAITNGSWLECDMDIVVISVDGTRIMIKPAEKEQV